MFSVCFQIFQAEITSTRASYLLPIECLDDMNYWPSGHEPIYDLHEMICDEFSSSSSWLGILQLPIPTQCPASTLENLLDLAYQLV